MDFSGKKLLIVDDEPDLREMISFEFDLLNFEVTESSSGQEAIELLKNGNQFDAIISDIRMPNGDGLILLKYLSPLKNRCPFVFISGFADLGPEEAFYFGAQSIFSKPFDLQNLVNAISNCLKSYKIRMSEDMENPSKKIELAKLSFTEMKDSFGITASGFYFENNERFNTEEKFNFKLTDDKNQCLEGIAQARWVRKVNENDANYLVGAEILNLSSESISLMESIKDTEAYTSPFIPSPKTFSE